MIRERIKRYIEQNKLFDYDAKLVVGLSGGADSMALLDVLIRLGYNCLAAHCNFHLRGSESDQDAVFVTQWCAERNIKLVSIDFDTVGYANNHKISIEMAARDLRYGWFEDIRKEHDSDYIAVAHHQNDSVETVLINLIRGTGISGLSGISNKNGKIVRPLLCVSRDEIEHYLQYRNIDYRTDSTNLQDIYLRNYVRLNLIPSLAQLNPSINDAIVRTAQNLSDVEKVYRNAIDKDINSVLSSNRINIDSLRKTIAPRSVLFEILSPLGFSSSAIDDIYDSFDATSGKIFYSHSHRLIKDREYYEIDELQDINNDNATLYIYRDDATIKIPLDMDISLHSYPVPISKSTKILYADADLLKFPLILRKWQSGDWFVPFGMKGRKKLSDFFTDQKFSLKDKEDVWILTSGDDVLWVVGHRSDNRYRVSDKTKEVLIIELKE